MELPKPTYYERKLASRLASKNIPYKSQSAIWYTRADYYTPDFVIGQKLIVEVDGKVHALKSRIKPDRIRQRALINLGYYVMRIRNEQIQRHAEAVVEEIIQRYYEIADLQNTQRKIEIVKSDTYDSIPRYVQENISKWAIAFNQSLKKESWTANYFKLNLPDYDSILVTNQSALEKFMLLLLGLNLKTHENGNLDFEDSAEVFGKSIVIVRNIFGDQGETAGIHLKNMFKVTAPLFFKNLVFFGGPNINPGIVSISNLNSLKAHIIDFNRHYSRYQVSVEEAEVKEECLYAFNNMEGSNSALLWLTEWNIR
jgi:very-short-patch-repair endonuclease